MKSLIAILLVLSIIFSCKESKKTETTDQNAESVINSVKDDLNNKLRIYIDGVIKNDIHPKIIYSDDFSTDEVLANKINGRPRMKQRLSFVFPESSIPYYFNIVFDNDCIIDLEQIVLNINDDRIIIRDSAFYEYFEFSKSLNERIKNRYTKY